MPENDLIAAEELAARLGVQPETVMRWARANLIPKIVVTPKVLRFDYVAVLRHLKEQSQRGARDGV
ncbi:MAG: hypothetical protein RLN76_07185 [Phycisphaeraceae bacterium]